MKQITMILRHTALGQKELLYRTEDIQVNNPHVTLGFLYFVAFPLSSGVAKGGPGWA